MRYLVKGLQSHERFELLLKLTKISSENMIDALRDHLVRGMDIKAAALTNGVKVPNLSIALSKMNERAEIVELIKEHDWQVMRQAPGQKRV